MNAKQLLVGLMTTAIATTAAFGQTPGVDPENGIYTVVVPEPGTFGLAFLQTVGGAAGSETTDNDWTRVRQLTIKGELNEDDLQYFTRMSNLDSLNMTGTTGLGTFTGCQSMPKLRGVALSPEVHIIGKDAFRECRELKYVNFENIDTIGEQAFNNTGKLKARHFPKLLMVGDHGMIYCKGITEIDAPLLQTLHRNAFYGCSELVRAHMPQLTGLGEGCFMNCVKLSQIVISDLTEEIGGSAFYDTAFTEFHFPSHLKRVGSYAFNFADNLERVVFPEGTKELGYCSFLTCPLRSITLPSTLQVIESSFGDVSYNDGGTKKYYLTDVYNYAVNPYKVKLFKDSAPTATLHVPYMSVGNYKLSEAWWSFGHTLALEEPIEHITITDEYFLLSGQGLAEKPSIEVRALLDPGTNEYDNKDKNSWGHLTFAHEGNLRLSKFRIVEHFKPEHKQTYYDDLGIAKYWNAYPWATTAISKSQVWADEVETEIRVPRDQWVFLSFNYDVNVADIKVAEGVKWTIRDYSGPNRASGEGDTWINLKQTDVMYRGIGYILRCSSENEFADFVFPATGDAMSKTSMLLTNDVGNALADYPAEHANNRSWNFVGNPYPAFYFIQSIDFNAPIIVYSHNGYQAYTPWDDEYVLRPNEAFFVQKPIDTDKIMFPREGAQHTQEPPAVINHLRQMARTRGLKRQVYNFYMSNDTHTDRARLALNAQASAEYEMNWDAEKMLTPEASHQLYIKDAGLNLSIDERPAQAEPYLLGYTATQSGKYTLAVEQKGTWHSILLTDALTGQTIDLKDGAYTFHTEAGAFDTRFSIQMEGQATGIDMANAAEVKVTTAPGRILSTGPATVYTTDGRLAYSFATAGQAQMAKGVYVARTAQGAQTIVVK